MSNTTEFKAIINAEIRTSVASSVTQQAQVTEESMKNIDQSLQAIKSKEITLHDNLRVGIRAVSTIQLLRFAMKDVQDLASGKGGMVDVLSLATSTMLIINTVNDLLRQEIALQMISNAAMAVGAVLSALNPVTAGLVAAGVLAVGVPAVVGAYTSWQYGLGAPERERVAMGREAYERIMSSSDQRQRLQEYRSITGQ